MSKWIFNIFIFPLLYLVSILPFWLLYGFSNVLFFIIFYIAGYRKKVVIRNLKNSFPEKTNKEINLIAKEFYRHLCDVIFETLKLYTISEKTFKKHCTYSQEAINLLNNHFNKNQSIVGVMGHMGNWEWGAMSHQVYFKQLITGVYHPLSNKNFDLFMLKLRGRFGGNIVAMTALYKKLISLNKKNTPTTIGLIADQTPPPESAYWINFLNQETPVFVGPEKIAKKFNYPVIYFSVTKLKRGYYELNIKPISENPKELPDGEISKLHTQALEENIKKQPAYWLWSHKRWKHKKPENIQLHK